MSDDAANNSSGTAAEQLVSLAEAATACGLSHDHLRNLVRAGTVWGIKIGRNWVTTVAAVNTYMATDRRPGPKPQPSPDEDN